MAVAKTRLPPSCRLGQQLGQPHHVERRARKHEQPVDLCQSAQLDLADPPDRFQPPKCGFDPRPRVQAGTWALLALAGGLMLLSLPLFPNELQAWGNNLAATAVLAIGLAWHIRHPPPVAWLATGDSQATT